jgi:hypothetical protein
LKTVRRNRPHLSRVTKLLWFVAAGLLVTLAVHALIGGV